MPCNARRQSASATIKSFYPERGAASRYPSLIRPYPRGVFVFELAAAALAVFLVGVIRDSRSFSNAVFLGLGLALGALGFAARLADTPDRPTRLLILALLLLMILGPLLTAGYLVVNGLTVARREGARPGTLLSLLAGVAIFAVIALDVAAERVGSVKLTLFTGITTLVFGYVSFLLVSYVIYAFLYGRMAAADLDADFVVVLGSGLKGGRRVTPLLASRLERGRQVYLALEAHGSPGPMLILSGGKGGDEHLPEAEAMARYLTERGCPPGRLILEDRSRTTEENLAFSKAIMDQARPGSRCVIVTSNFHVFRSAILARRLGVNGHVTGAPTAAYYWPTAMLREFAAVFVSYKLVNFGVCVLIVVLPLAYAALRGTV
jgi:uncharacterized SAM-binding protein YcdF (DUF218 family)